jgi:hypothetical protein
MLLAHIATQMALVSQYRSSNHNGQLRRASPLFCMMAKSVWAAV